MYNYFKENVTMKKQTGFFLEEKEKKNIVEAGKRIGLSFSAFVRVASIREANKILENQNAN